jgi:hypothetical protein
MEPARIRTLAERIEDRMLIIVSGRESGGHSPELRAAYRAQLEQMRRQLGANADTDMLELLLIERVVICWLKLQHVEEQSSFTMAGGSSVVMAEQWDRRLETANGRFLRAATALARVRNLQQRPRGMGASQAAALLKNLSTSDWSASDGLRNAMARRKSE